MVLLLHICQWHFQVKGQSAYSTRHCLSTEWPGGLAHVVVAGLMKKYRPQDTMTHVELRQRLNQFGMKKGQDPAT